MQTVAVLGSGGFVGSHLVKQLKTEGKIVHGVDLKQPEFSRRLTDKFYAYDLREAQQALYAVSGCDLVYQLAADMGGADYIFGGQHDAEVMSNNARINLNVLEACRLVGVEKVFFSSSACVYPTTLQTEVSSPAPTEDQAIPADPDHTYGWEKLFSERCYLAYQQQYGLQVRIARFHSIVGPEGTWQGGKEKVFAAVARKIAEAEDGGEISIYGDGEQTRTFLHVHDCIRGIQAIMEQEESGPFNLGGDELISINDLVGIFCEIAHKKVLVKHVDGPLGVRGRLNDSSKLRKATGWQPTKSLWTTAAETYRWIEIQVKQHKEHK